MDSAAQIITASTGLILAINKVALDWYKTIKKTKKKGK